MTLLQVYERLSTTSAEKVLVESMTSVRTPQPSSRCCRKWQLLDIASRTISWTFILSDHFREPLARLSLSPLSLASCLTADAASFLSATKLWEATKTTVFCFNGLTSMRSKKVWPPQAQEGFELTTPLQMHFKHWIMHSDFLTGCSKVRFAK